MGVRQEYTCTYLLGIIHEEYHSTKFAKEGGIFEMCQLWVNLPKKHKVRPEPEPEPEPY